MLVFFSGRRLRGDVWDDFRKAWGGDGDEALQGLPEGAVIYHARNIKDEDEVISFGIFPVDRNELHVIRGSDEDELKRQDAMAEFVRNIPLEGVYEVVEEIKP
jgi:hypothetical protein